MDKALLADRVVNRLGISTAALRTTGMWGEPAGRAAAVGAIRRAVELGVEVLEVPVPFGPAADLVREAGVGGAFIVARLTGPVGDPEVVRRRLGGRRPDLVLAGIDRVDDLRRWASPRGAIVGPGSDYQQAPGIVAVRGPYPPAPGAVEWCEGRGIAYLAPSTRILDQGRLTIAVPAPHGLEDVERLLSGGGVTPPAAGPG